MYIIYGIIHVLENGLGIHENMSTCSQDLKPITGFDRKPVIPRNFRESIIGYYYYKPFYIPGYRIPVTVIIFQLA